MKKFRWSFEYDRSVYEGATRRALYSWIRLDSKTWCWDGKSSEDKFMYNETDGRWYPY